MSVRVKMATAPEEIRSLMGIRHQVLVEENGDLAPQGGTIVDLYDTLPTTEHLIATAHGEVIGGVRVTKDSPAGMPADGYFDFRLLLPDGAQLATCSMVCLRSSEQTSDRLVQAVLRMAAYWAAARGLTYLCTTVAPKVAPLVQDIGFDPVGAPFEDALGLTAHALVLGLSANSLDYTELVRRPDAKLWLDRFERAVFGEGDIIVQRGEAGDEAYLIVEGRADVLAYGAEPGGPIVRTFGAGDLFGELALLTDRPRSATVVAAEPVETMVLSREEFERKIADNPSLSLALLGTIGARFHETIVVLNETEDLNRTEQIRMDAEPGETTSGSSDGEEHQDPKEGDDEEGPNKEDSSGGE